MKNGGFLDTGMSEFYRWLTLVFIFVLPYATHASILTEGAMSIEQRSHQRMQQNPSSHSWSSRDNGQELLQKLHDHREALIDTGLPDEFSGVQMYANYSPELAVDVRSSESDRLHILNATFAGDVDTAGGESLDQGPFSSGSIREGYTEPGSRDLSAVNQSDLLQTMNNTQADLILLMTAGLVGLAAYGRSRWRDCVSSHRPTPGRHRKRRRESSRDIVLEQPERTH